MAKRTRPAPEVVKLDMRQKARDLVYDDRRGKPNLSQNIERALVNAWKAGRDAAEQGVADPAPPPETPDTPVPVAKLGTKTHSVLYLFGLYAYDCGEENRENDLFWYPKGLPLGGQKFWYIGATDDGLVPADKSHGDASLQACVNLGLFASTQLRDQDGMIILEDILVSTQKTRPTYLALRERLPSS